MAPSGSPAERFLVDTTRELSALSTSRPLELLATSDRLLAQFRDALHTSRSAMLPSFTRTLPSGEETGSALAIDLGGSTLRVATVQLSGRSPSTEGTHGRSGTPLHILERQEWRVDREVKALPGAAFFDWIAARVGQVLQTSGKGNGGGMSVGMTWSFPIEQTSPSSGILRQMGKGYKQWASLDGTDLKDHLQAAFGRQGLHIEIQALMNDTEATLLSHAYENPATRIALVWGTGCNAALILPLAAVSREKLGQRSEDWLDATGTVVVNTEVSMFGRDVFPITKVDLDLDACSDAPGFQPLEQLTSGRYLGEMCRLYMMQAVERGALFRGIVPERLRESYGLDGEMIADLESMRMEEALARIAESIGPSKPPTAADLDLIRTLSRSISERAALLMAVTVYTLWRLQHKLSQETVDTAAHTFENDQPIAVAYCGAVADRHPGVRQKCQEALNLLIGLQAGGLPNRRLLLEAAPEAGILGAAVGAILNCPKGDP